MAFFCDIELSSQEFFRLHWSSACGKLPKWSEPWDMQEGHPNHKFPGCYALFDQGGRLIYIGSASRKSDGDLAARLLQHVIRPLQKGGPYEPKKKWQSRVSAIRTIAFSKKYGYMALAIEQFLIRRYPTEFNKR